MQNPTEREQTSIELYDCLFNYKQTLFSQIDLFLIFIQINTFAFGV